MAISEPILTTLIMLEKESGFHS